MCERRRPPAFGEKKGGLLEVGVGVGVGVAMGRGVAKWAEC